MYRQRGIVGPDDVKGNNVDGRSQSSSSDNNKAASVGQSLTESDYDEDDDEPDDELENADHHNDDVVSNRAAEANVGGNGTRSSPSSIGRLPDNKHPTSPGVLADSSCVVPASSARTMTNSNAYESKSRLPVYPSPTLSDPSCRYGSVDVTFGKVNNGNTRSQGSPSDFVGTNRTVCYTARDSGHFFVSPPLPPPSSTTWTSATHSYGQQSNSGQDFGLHQTLHQYRNYPQQPQVGGAVDGSVERRYGPFELASTIDAQRGFPISMQTVPWWTYADRSIRQFNHASAVICDKWLNAGTWNLPFTHSFISHHYTDLMVLIYTIKTIRKPDKSVLN